MIMIKFDFTFTVPKNLNHITDSQPTTAIADYASYHSTYDRFDSKLFFSTVHDQDYRDKLNVVNGILDDCVVRVNFWGRRELVSKSHVDMPVFPIHLETVAFRTLEVGYKNELCRIDEDLSPNDLRLKEGICQKLKNFYSTSDVQIDNSNPLTKIFNAMQEQFRPFAWLVDLTIGTIIGYPVESPTVRQKIEEYSKS
jgi:hypothetical protein